MEQNKIVSMEDNSGAEFRNFELNFRKATRNLEECTDRQDIVIERTGGGIVLKLNAGSYQLLKYAARSYYTSESLALTCTITPVFDKKGCLIETKYRLTKGRSGLYTLNLYHTRCSALVNGKADQHFIETDLPNIIKLAEQNLSDNNTTLSELNNHVSESLRCLTAQEYDMNKSANEEITPIIDTPDTEVSSDDQTLLSESAFQTTLTNSSSDCSTPLKPKSSSDILSSIHSDILAVKHTLQSHINETEKQVSILKDEIHSVKRQNSLLCQRLQEEMEQLQHAMKAIELKVVESSQSIFRRVQSLEDQVRSTNSSNHAAPTCMSTPTNSSNHAAPTCMSTPSTQTINDTQVRSANSANQLSSTCMPTRFSQPIHITQERRTEYESMTTSTSNNTYRRPDRRAARRRIMTLSGGHQLEYYDIAGTFIIGDSILKGIKTRGLHDDVDIETLPGKKTRDVCLRLKYIDLSKCNNLVIYIGGNDVASGVSIASMKRELKEMLEKIDNGSRKVYLCSLSPRIDVDVSPVNHMLETVCNETYAKLLDVNSYFVFENGQPKSFMYYADGIHLNARGSSTIVKAINNRVRITRQQKPPYQNDGRQQYNREKLLGSRRQPWASKHLQCRNCGMHNHVTSDCRRNVGLQYHSSYRRSLGLNKQRYNESYGHRYQTSHNGWGRQYGRDRRDIDNYTRETDYFFQRSPSFRSHADVDLTWENVGHSRRTSP